MAPLVPLILTAHRLFEALVPSNVCATLTDDWSPAISSPAAVAATATRLISSQSLDGAFSARASKLDSGEAKFAATVLRLRPCLRHKEHGRLALAVGVRFEELLSKRRVVRRDFAADQVKVALMQAWHPLHDDDPLGKVDEAHVQQGGEDELLAAKLGCVRARRRGLAPSPRDTWPTTRAKSQFRTGLPTR